MAFQKAPAISFNTKTANFPERVYGISNPNTRLHKFMWAMLEIGLGQLDNLQVASEIGQQSIGGTAFSELDDFFAFLGVTRLPQEVYSYNPQRDPLTLSQWQEVIAKDSSFRMRILKFMQALTRGGTVEGIEMAAYAASGVRCTILETWRTVSGSSIDIPEWNGYRPDKNFLIIPTESITEQQKLAIIHLVNLLKPVDTVCSVFNDPLELRKYEEVSIRWLAASNHYYTITKKIAVDTSQIINTSLSILPNSVSGEAGTYAYMDTMDQEWDLTGYINSARASVSSKFYTIKFGTIVDDTGGTLKVTITDTLKTPNAPVFTIKVDNEIMRVINKKTNIDTENTVEFTVLRAQEGTAQAVHAANAAVYTDTVVIETVIPASAGQQSYWKDIPATPSDTYEDASGKVFSLWGNNRQKYVDWFASQIRKLGGQVKGEQYRFPLEFATEATTETFRAEDAIITPTIEVISVVLPGANE